MSTLSAEELEILESVELGEWQSIADLPEAINQYQRYALAQTNELAAISIGLPTDDLQMLKIMAQQADTSVALLIASVLHQYVAHQSFSVLSVRSLRRSHGLELALSAVHIDSFLNTRYHYQHASTAIREVASRTRNCLIDLLLNLRFNFNFPAVSIQIVS